MFNKTIQKSIKIDGMQCSHCASRVENALKNIKGVKSVKVDLSTGNVTITSNTELDNTLISTLIENLGYTIKNN